MLILSYFRTYRGDGSVESINWVCGSHLRTPERQPRNHRHLAPLRVVAFQPPKYPIRHRFQSGLNKDDTSNAGAGTRFSVLGSRRIGVTPMCPILRDKLKPGGSRARPHSNIRVSGTVPRWLLNQWCYWCCSCFLQVLLA